MARLALLLLCLAATARAEWQWRASGGGEVNASSHGVFDLGVQRGPLSIQLFTDTLDVRWAPESAGGRWWVAARGEALAAGLLISPWTDGAPDPSRALYAQYAGLEGGWIRYQRYGVYAGVTASARVYFFEARDEQTTIPVPGTTSLVTADMVLGRWSPELHVWARLGADVENTTVQPHVAVEAIWRPVAPVAPRLELRAGAAYGQDFLTRTRLGGLNPYVVPLAGAGWAEFWVENYVAARLALTWTGRYTEVGAAMDAAAFDEQLATGFALLLRGHWRRFFAEAQLGWAPWLHRQPGVLPLSAWFLIGAEWGPFHRPM